jgi:hypothetical protein
MLMVDKTGFIHRITLTVRQVVEELLDFDDERKNLEGNYSDVLSDAEKSRLIFAAVVKPLDDGKHFLMFLPDGTITGMSIGCLDIWGIHPNMLGDKINVVALMPQLHSWIEKKSSQHNTNKFKFQVTIGESTFLIQAKAYEINEQAKSRYLEFSADQIQAALHTVPEAPSHHPLGVASQVKARSQVIQNVHDDELYSWDMKGQQGQPIESTPVLQSMLSEAEVFTIPSLRNAQVGGLMVQSEHVLAHPHIEEREEDNHSLSDDEDHVQLVKMNPRVPSVPAPGSISLLKQNLASRTKSNTSFSKVSAFIESKATEQAGLIGLLAATKKSIRESIKGQKGLLKSSDDEKAISDVDDIVYKDIVDKILPPEHRRSKIVSSTALDVVPGVPALAKQEEALNGKDSWIIQSYVSKRKKMDNVLLNRIWNNMLILFTLLIAIAVVEALTFTSLLNEIEERITRVRTAGLRRYNIMNSLHPIQRLYYLHKLNITTGVLSSEEHIKTAVEANHKLVDDNTILMVTGTPCPNSDTTLECRKRSQLFSTGVENAEEIINLMTLRSGLTLDCYANPSTCRNNSNRERNVEFVIASGVEEVIPVSNTVTEYYSVFYDDRVKSMTNSILYMTFIPMVLSFLLSYGFIYPNIRRLEFRIVNTLHNFFYISNNRLDGLVTKAHDHIADVNETFKTYSFISEEDLRMRRMDDDDEVAKGEEKVIGEKAKEELKLSGSRRGDSKKIAKAFFSTGTGRFQYQGFWQGFGICNGRKAPPRLFKYSNVHMLFVVLFTFVFFGFNCYFATTTIQDSSR